MTRAARRCADRGRDRGTTTRPRRFHAMPCRGSDDELRQRQPQAERRIRERMRRRARAPVHDLAFDDGGRRRADGGHRMQGGGGKARVHRRQRDATYQAAARIRNGARSDARRARDARRRRRAPTPIRPRGSRSPATRRRTTCAARPCSCAKPRLRGERGAVQQRMRVLELAQHARRIRFERRIQRDDHRRRCTAAAAAC